MNANDCKKEIIQKLREIMEIRKALNDDDFCLSIYLTRKGDYISFFEMYDEADEYTEIGSYTERKDRTE